MDAYHPFSQGPVDLNHLITKHKCEYGITGNLKQRIMQDSFDSLLHIFDLRNHATLLLAVLALPYI